MPAPQTSASTTLVALIDIGVDLQHPDLQHALRLNAASPRSGDKHGWNFIADNNDASDDNGHGTQIAGIIAKSAARLKTSRLKHCTKWCTSSRTEVAETMIKALAS